MLDLCLVLNKYKLAVASNFDKQKNERLSVEMCAYLQLNWKTEN